MIISYAGRLICAAVVVFGLVHLVVEAFFWATAPFAMRIASVLTARQRERLLYAINVVPILVALALTGVVCIPQYVRSESNLAPEAISGWCIAAALVISLWYGSSLIRGVAIAARTLSFARSSRRNSRPTSFRRDEMPILSYPGSVYSVALVGLIHPVILISDSLLGEGGLSKTAIDIVLDHEVSHARQRDNWKLFSLFCLPTLPLKLRGGQTWTELWQSAAEWAADDDAVHSDKTRVLVLAETLVAVARRSVHHRKRVCMALASSEGGLATRVNRLLDAPNDTAASSPRCHMWGLALGVAGLFAGMAAVMLSSHDFMERLIRLGQI